MTLLDMPKFVVGLFAYYTGPRRDRNPNYPLDVVDKLEEATMPKVEAWLGGKIAAGKNNECTMETASVRREWCV